MQRGQQLKIMFFNTDKASLKTTYCNTGDCLSLMVLPLCMFFNTDKASLKTTYCNTGACLSVMVLPLYNM